MSDHLHGGEPLTPTIFSSSSQGKRIIPQAPRTSSDPLEAQASSLCNTDPPPLACPVPPCPSVLRGGAPHRYLKRHLKHPGLHGRTGDEKAAWLNLHNMEHERLLAALGTIPSHGPNTKEVPEVNQVDYIDAIKLVEYNREEEERKKRTAEFELRANNIGITDEMFVAQKVAIWEGMRAAKLNGDDTGYYEGVLLDAATGADQ